MPVGVIGPVALEPQPWLASITSESRIAVLAVVISDGAHCKHGTRSIQDLVGGIDAAGPAVEAELIEAER
jgi:hypothetical protein